MSEQKGKRNEPELKAREEVDRAPGFQDPAGSVPDPSGKTEITEEDHDNPLVNDSSFTEFDDRDDTGK